MTNIDKLIAKDKKYIVTDTRIQPFFSDNAIVDVQDVINAYEEALQSVFESDLLSLELAEITRIVNNETSCVIEHSKDRVTVASLVL